MNPKIALFYFYPTWRGKKNGLKSQIGYRWTQNAQGIFLVFVPQLYLN